MKLTVKNIGPNPTYVRSDEGRKELERGASVTAEFSVAEAANINANKAVFEVEGFVRPSADALKGPSGPEAEFRNADGDTAEMAQMRRTFDQSWRVQGDELAAARAQLADIAALFGSDVKPEEVKDKVAALLAQPATGGDGITIATGGGGGGAPVKTTLAEAVASLDDKNDAHWTQGGKPDLDTLKEITGGDVKRADVDALTPPRERKTA